MLVQFQNIDAQIAFRAIRSRTHFQVHIEILLTIMGYIAIQESSLTKIKGYHRLVKVPHYKQFESPSKLRNL
jgi:hypothetical protein